MGGPDECTALVGMPFIVSSNVEKVDPATRKLIRSHARRGKRRKKGGEDQDQRLPSMWKAASRVQVARVNLEELAEMYMPIVPRRVGSEFSCVELGDGVESDMVLNIARVSAVAMEIIFPLMAAIGFQADRRAWLSSVVRDTAALYITAFAMESFTDRILHSQKGINVAATQHLQKGLRLLRKRLLGGDDETKVSDLTLTVVVKLASAAHFDGDARAAKQHMQGLRKMVDLRGGLDAFQFNQILMEMMRCDLSIALLNTSTPVFFRQPSEPVISYPEALLPTPNDHTCTTDTAEVFKNIDQGLATAWSVLRRFCLLVDLGTQTQRQIRPELIRDTMVAVMYRLLHMKFVTGSLDETVRHGLLAVSHHVFLQWQDVRLPYRDFPTAHRDCIMGFELGDGASSRLMLWLLMTAAISIFDVERDVWLGEFLRDCVERCGVRSWKEMQDVLKSFIWVALLDAEPGKQIFDSLGLGKGGSGYGS